MVGTVTLRSGGTSTVPLRISKNWDQPWRLRFGSKQIALGGPQPKGTVVVYLRNDDPEPFTIDIGGDRGTAKVEPGSSVKIFDGTLAGLLGAGRLDQQELYLTTTRTRKVNLTLRFECGVLEKDLELYIDTWYLSYQLF